MTLALSALAIAVFAAAAASDVGWRRIPNRLVLVLVALGLVRLGLAWGEGAAGADLAASLAVLAAGAVVFHFGLVGGGDVKLLAAGALWLGAGAVWPFLVATALAGGALALGFLLSEALARRRAGPPRQAPSLPYGVAIAAAGILCTAGAL